MNESDSQPLDYPPRPVLQPITSVRLTVALTVGVALVEALAFLVVPRFERILRDFKTDLPTITKLYLAVNRWITDDYGCILLVPIPIVVPIVLTQLLWRPPDERKQTHKWMS